MADEEFVNASNIFVFRLMATELVDESHESNMYESLEGRIRVVENLRGNSIASQIKYSASKCCGVELHVGSYYLAILDKNETSFYPSSIRVFDITRQFWEDADNWVSGRLLQKLHPIVLGDKKFSELDASVRLISIGTMPPPPSPPPRPPKKADVESLAKDCDVGEK